MIFSSTFKSVTSSKYIAGSFPGQTNKLVSYGQQYAVTHFTAFVVFCHLLFAAILFSPYFLYNYVLLANTDMMDFNVPMFILAKRSIIEGHLNLWNPYLLNGTSSLLSSVAPIYSIINPFNWILFFLPEKYIFLAGTFLPFTYLWLIGVVSYFFFVEEVESRKWAFFAATAYQLCGYTLWWIWTFELSSMWLWVIVALYLIWTAHNRKAYLHYILLSLVVVQLLLPSYSIAAINMMILLGLMTLYRYLSMGSKQRWHHLFTSGGALFTGTLIFMIRLLPTWFEANLTSRIQSFALDFRDLSFLGLRLFVPEMIPIDNHSSWLFLTAALPNEKNDFGLHVHNYFPQFFGVLIALLVLWGILSLKMGNQVKLRFWSVYVMIMLAAIIRIEPVDSIFRILLGPIHLPMSLQIFLPLGICTSAGLAAKNLERSEPDFLITNRTIILFSAILMVILTYSLFMWIPPYPQVAGLARLAIIAIVLLIGILWFSYQRWPVRTSRIISYFSYIIISLLLILSLYNVLLATDTNQTFLTSLRNISISILLLSFIYLWIRTRSTRLNGYWWVGSIFLLITGFIFIVILYPQVASFKEQPSTGQQFQLAMLGTARFIIVGLSFITILYLLQRRKFRKDHLIYVFFLLLIFDLLPANRIHSFMLSTPFHKESTIFPADEPAVFGTNGLPVKLDNKDYRVNRPSAMLKLPYGLELYGEKPYLMTGSSVYGIRAYEGYYNGVLNRYRQFVSNWSAGSADFSHGIFTVTDDRFLALSGVRYDYNPETNTIQVRNDALSRFMLFDTYEVIEDGQKTLDRLKEPDFFPLETIILDKDPEISKTASNHESKTLDYVEHSTDMIELRVNSEQPGIISFNDNYHPEWKAYVNGQEQPIFVADFNFMAVKVPAGESQVIFHYQPRFFYYGAYLAGVGVLLFLVISTGLYIARDRLDGVNAKAPIQQPSFRQKVLGNFRTFRLVYFSLIFLIIVAVAQAIFNFREAGIVYKDFYIVSSRDKYYALPQDMWPVSITDTRNFSACIQTGSCTIANSYEEAEQFIDQPVELRLATLVEEGYRGFNILQYQNKFYATPQSPWIFNLLDQDALRECQAESLCVIADTLERTKQLVDVLPSRAENKLSSLIKSITTHSPRPNISGERLFDWQSEEWTEFPASIDITFRQPVKLRALEFQIKVSSGKQVPQQISVLGGEDLENPQYQAVLLLNFDEYTDQVFSELPDQPENYQHYRIVFTNTRYKEYPKWLTIRSTQLYVLVEEDYKGFNIYWDQDKYYVVSRELEPIALDNLSRCYLEGLCSNATSLEEARQLVNEQVVQTP